MPIDPGGLPDPPYWPYLLYPLSRSGGSWFVTLPDQVISLRRPLAWRVLSSCTGRLALPDLLARYPLEQRSTVVDLLRAFHRRGVIAERHQAYLALQALSANRPQAMKALPGDEEGSSPSLSETAIRRAALPLGDETRLSPPIDGAAHGVGRLMCQRRSRRTFGSPLSRATLERLLLDGLGCVGFSPLYEGSQTEVPYQTIPQAGAISAVEALLVVASAEGLAAGCYRFCHLTNSLHTAGTIAARDEVFPALNLPEESVANLAAVIVLGARLDRKSYKYGNRGYRYVLIEVGCAAQNILLAATEAGVSAYPFGGFFDEPLARALGMAYPLQAPLLAVVMGGP